MKKSKAKTQSKKMGRPVKQINWTIFDNLCRLQCTEKEIADFFDCDVDTITALCKRVKGMTFSDYYEQKKGQGKVSLRRLQWRSARDGNVTMQIWLGKQELSQSDKQELTGKAGGPIRIYRVRVNESGQIEHESETAN